MKDKILNPDNTLDISQPPLSEWTCYLFGSRPSDRGIDYTPSKGHVPNIFVRFMMRVCFDCLWVKYKENPNE